MYCLSCVVILLYYLVGESPNISTETNLFTASYGAHVLTKSSGPERFVVSSSRPGQLAVNMSQWSAKEK